jgi:hypothetical protein
LTTGEKILMKIPPGSAFFWEKAVILWLGLKMGR